MADIAAAVRRAPADLRVDLRVVFVTTDPERDTARSCASGSTRFAVPVTGCSARGRARGGAGGGGHGAAEKQGRSDAAGRPDAHEHRPAPPLTPTTDRLDMVSGTQT
jgi:hypothetical protein